MSNWREQASCRDVDPDIFFPVGNLFPHETQEALGCCAVCDVTAECLQYAIDTGDDVAIAGGTTPEMRREDLKKGTLSPTPEEARVVLSNRQDYDPQDPSRLRYIDSRAKTQAKRGATKKTAPGTTSDV